VAENDNGTPRAIPLDQVILTYDRLTDHMDVGGVFASLDLALDMLARARRALEAQLRKQQALELQGALQDQARAAELARRVRGGG
jgi:hypothetical protein